MTLNGYHKDSAIEGISLFDMIFDPKKREIYYKNIDSNYEETEDEKEIFKEANKRRIKSYD